MALGRHRAQGDRDDAILLAVLRQLEAAEAGLQRDGDVLVGDSGAAGAGLVDLDKKLLRAMAPVVVDVARAGDRGEVGLDAVG